MSANLEAKKLVVEEIKNKLTNAKSAAFVDYCGMTVQQDYEMRKAFREAGGEYKVYKNRLMLRALNDLGITGCEKYLEGNTAIAFSIKDEVIIPKILLETVEKTKKIKVKFGILSGKAIDAGAVEVLAKLPSKETLVAMLLGVLQEPMRKTVRVLSAPARGMVTALDAVANKK